MKEFNTPMVARVDGIWRPVWGEVVPCGTRVAAHYILNGKEYLEVKSGNWRNFNQTTSRSQLFKFAMKYNLNDLDSIIRTKNAKEREQKFPEAVGEWVPRFRAPSPEALERTRQLLRRPRNP
jgi:hypothetical protein